MRITHLHIFLIGWIYYLGVPVAFAYTGTLDSVWFAEPWLRHLDTEGSWKWALPLYAVLMPIAFYAGDKLSCLTRHVKPQMNHVQLANNVLLPIYAFLLLLFTVAARERLFSGYVEGQDSALIVGPIATLQMAVLFQYLLCKAAGKRTIARLNLLLLIFSSVVLLGMGARLYVVTSLVAIYFYFLNWGSKNRKERRRSVLWIFFIPIPLAVIGMWRYEISDFNVWILFLNLFTEPFLSSISAFTFMQSGNWLLIDFRAEFLSSFLNIIPSTIWPDKVDFFTSTEAKDFVAPFGGLSVVTSSVLNFGFIGGLIFTAFVGFVMGRSRRNAVSPIAKALYCYLVGLMLFIFFRDPFYIQVKAVLTGFMLAWMYQFISYLSKNRKPNLNHSIGFERILQDEEASFPRPEKS